MTTSINGTRLRPPDSQEVGMGPRGWSPGSWLWRLCETRALMSLTGERNSRADDFLHMAHVNVTCKVLRTEGSRVALWFLTVM